MPSQVELGAPIKSISQEEPLFCDERNERAISLGAARSQAGWGRRTDERQARCHRQESRAAAVLLLLHAAPDPNLFL